MRWHVRKPTLVELLVSHPRSQGSLSHSEQYVKLAREVLRTKIVLDEFAEITAVPITI